MRRRTRRRPLSMTSLIDVIFLLLMFFMLSSTFSRFGEVELHVGGSGGRASTDNMLFLRLDAERLSLNGTPLDLPQLAPRLTAETAPNIVVSVTADVTAQRMTDLLVALRAAPQASITLLGDS